jgi:hypothetical protein
MFAGDNRMPSLTYRAARLVTLLYLQVIAQEVTAITQLVQGDNAKAKIGIAFQRRGVA